MTIALSIKIDDGIVLASDTFTIAHISTVNRRISNSYNNAEKIYKLRKDLSMGIISWGDGRIFDASIKSIVKNFIVQSDGISSEDYTVKMIADSLGEFIYANYYIKESDRRSAKDRPEFNCYVVGYDSHGQLPRVYELSMPPINGMPVQQHDGIINFGGSTEAIYRLTYGFSSSIKENMLKIINNTGAAAELKTLTEQVFTFLRNDRERIFADPGMPLQDAIDLARFIISTEIGFNRFSFGSKSVGGNCNIATVTKRDGFRWIQRNKPH